MTIKLKSDARSILANNIIYYRLQKGWSQEDFADKLGTTPTYVSNLLKSILFLCQFNYNIKLIISTTILLLTEEQYKIRISYKIIYRRYCCEKYL